MAQQDWRTMKDSNMIIHTKDGKEIAVVWPQLVQREYSTKWLEDRPGSREFNISVIESLDRWRTGKEFQDGKFVIIPNWESGKPYGDYTDSLAVIPFDSVIYITPLPHEKFIKAMSNMAEYEAKAKREAIENPNRNITYREFIELSKRVQALEEQASRPDVVVQNVMTER